MLEVLPSVLSAGSLAVAITALVLTYRRSGKALELSRAAAANALWLSVQQAVQRFIGFDPTAEPIGERLANLRIAAIALVDELEDWVGLDTWLEAERNLGAVLGRQVMETAGSNDPVDQRLLILDPYQQWAHRLSQNLRRFRAAGFDAHAAEQLRASAESQVDSIRAQHGWASPPTTDPV